jgi:hypothetical protein
MADAKISALTELAEAPAAGDLFAVVDVSDTTDAASGTTKRITAANLGVGAGGGGETWRQMLWPVLPIATVGNWSVAVNTSVVFNIRTDGAVSHVVGDSIEWEADFSAGTWTFELRFLAISSGGIATLSIGGTSVGGFDTYAATSTNNTTAQITGVTIGTTGSKRVKLTMATKNASSSGFRCYMTYLAAQRTA